MGQSAGRRPTIPTQPRTWGTGDPVTATYLDGDLYTIAGAQFAPNGVLFHARPPLYKSVPASSPNINGTTWSFAFQDITLGPVNSAVQIDNSGYSGILMDPSTTGGIESAVTAADGTASDVGGGWYVMSAFVPIAGTGDNVLNAASLAKGTVVPEFYGTYQRANTAHDSAPFILDLVNTGTSSWTPAGWTSHAAGSSIKSTGDGSGKSCRWQAHWACNSTAAPSGTLAPAPRQSWGTADAWTVSFANGNTGVRDLLSFMNNPPCFRAHETVAQTPAASTATVMTLGGVDIDTFSGWNAGTSTYTVPAAGLYLVHGIVGFNHPASLANVQCAVRINGTDYYGPAGNSCTDSNAVAAAKTQIFSLNSGDTIQLIGWNDNGAIATASGVVPRLVIVWLSGQGTPSPLPSVPDISYRYTAGTPVGTVPSVFNAHLANDLSFLTYRPYLLAYQGTVQANMAGSTDEKVTMDTVAGIVHGDGGDNYSGWNATNHNYVAQRAGWYMCVEEIMLQKPVTTTSPSAIGDFLVSTSSGGTTWDEYQQLTAANPATGCSGAAAVSYYYLRALDTITPGVWFADYTAGGTASTNVSTGRNSHCEFVWLST